MKDPMSQNPQDDFIVEDMNALRAAIEAFKGWGDYIGTNQRHYFMAKAIRAYLDARPAASQETAAPSEEPVAFIIEKLDGSRRSIMLASMYDPRKAEFWVNDVVRQGYRIIPLFPATKDGEDELRRAWEYGRNSWCPAGIVKDKERTERDWREALAALAQAPEAKS